MTSLETRRRAPAVLVAVVALALTGCASATTINMLRAEPQRYANDDVSLKGTVIESASVLGRGAYKLDDGTGTIWVVSTEGVPRKGARVEVRGKVRDVANVGDLVPLPPEVGEGLVLVADEHRAQ